MRPKPIKWKSLSTGNEFDYTEYQSKHLPSECPFTLLYSEETTPLWFDGDINEYRSLSFNYINNINLVLIMYLYSSENPYISEFNDLFEKCVFINNYDKRLYSAFKNWLIGPVSAWMNDKKKSLDEFPMKLSKIEELVCLVEFGGIINFTTAKTHIFPELIDNPLENIFDIIERKKLIQNNDVSDITKLAIELISKFPEKVKEYNNGKATLLGFFIGELIKLSGKEKINPKIAGEVIKGLLV